MALGTGAMTAKRVGGSSPGLSAPKGRSFPPSTPKCLELFARVSHMELSEMVCQKWTHSRIRTHISALGMLKIKVFPRPLCFSGLLKIGYTLLIIYII